MFTIDHLVLPAVSLEIARRRLRSLGFTVAADAKHPFGTGNACVFMDDGTYLEPLSVVDAGLYESAIASGNMFVGQDRDFRALRGEGLSGVALASDDARADHERLAAAGMAGGDMLEFSRLATLPDGSQKMARFHLAFAARDAADSFGVFTCQRLDPLPADRAALERHDNRVLALVEVVLVTGNPVSAGMRLEVALDGKMEERGAGNRALPGKNAAVRVLDAKNFAQEFVMEAAGQANPSPGLCGAAIVFRVPDLAVTRAVLAANDVAFMDKGSRIMVAPAPGQGVVFAFEE